MRYYDNLESLKRKLLDKKKDFCKKNKKMQPSKAKLIVANALPHWMQVTLEKLHSIFLEKKALPSLSVISALLNEEEVCKKHKKEAMPFVAKIKNEVEVIGEDAFKSQTVIENEKEILEMFVPLLKKSLGVDDIEVCYNDNENENVKPGFPNVLYSV